MKIRGGKRNIRRGLVFGLAVLLWAEGTLGSVCAAPEAAGGNTTISASAEGGIVASDGAKAPAEGEASAPGEEKPAEGETPAPGEEKPAEGEAPAPGGEKPAEGETSAPGEEKPAEGEAPAPGEEKPAEGETPAPGEEKPAEEETPVPKEDVSAEGEDSAADDETEKVTEGESVSENTAAAEEDLLPEQIPGEGKALGEPPLPAESGGSMGIMSYGNGVMSTNRQDLSLQTPSLEDIIAHYKAHPWKLDVKNTYSDRPSTKKPYNAGHLSDESLNNALNLLNFIRYVAGIPDNVTLNEDYIELTQAGALVNCVNGKLTHEPSKPTQSGFPDDLYEKGKEGCGSSNIAWNYDNMAQSLLNGWMFDGDSSNIDRVGHRRWALNPSMEQTGFGAVGAYSAMYAFDRSGSNITNYVAWPARNMPIELMNGSATPWTLSLGSDYQSAEQGQITVTLKNVSSGKTWTFSEKKKDGYFKVNNGGYGMPNCIIFRPNGFSYDKGNNSQFYVTVTGLKDQEGNAATISYNVDFFSLSDTPKEVERVTLNAETLHLLLEDADGKGQAALHAVLKPSNAADKTLTWASLNADVAAVDENGLVTAKGVGETTVTVTAVNGRQAACEVKVSQYTLSAEGITSVPDPSAQNEVIYQLDFELRGDDPQEQAKKIAVLDGDVPATDKVIWSSENQNVVKVDANGGVTPVGVGEARIWANVDNGLKILSCEVTVTNAELPVMQMRESSVTMNWQEEKQLRVYLSPVGTKWENGKEKYIKWTTKNPGKAVFWDDEEKWSKEEIIGGNTVTVLPLAAGTTTITAEIVDEAGNPAAGIDAAQGRGTASCEVTVQKRVELPEGSDEMCFIVLTNTQKNLGDVELPDGWNWKYPDTSLAQFAGQRSKLFAAEYLPAENEQASEGTQPAETLLPVYFLTLDKISMCVKHKDNDGAARDVSVLKSGWVSYCYVNYSFEETLEQFEKSNTALKDNTWYQTRKTELLKQLDDSITLTSSKPKILTVESVKNAAGKTALTAKTSGNAELRAELKLGSKTFKASKKLTVAESVGTNFNVVRVDCFGKIGGEDSCRYAAKLSDFPSKAQGGVNSKINLNMTGVTKLTVKSSNSKVVALKSSTVKPKEKVDFEIPLMVKAAGTAAITVTGNDTAKTSHILTLVVTDACPGLDQETVTVNTWRTAGTDFSLYAAKDETGAFYEITDVSLEDAATGGKHSGKFQLIPADENTQDGGRRDCKIEAKADTRNGTYKVRLRVAAGGEVYYLPLTVKVVSNKPKCSVKQKNKLNLFYQDTRSLLTIQTEEKVKAVSLTGCNYLVELSNSQDGYYVMPALGATVNSVKKGKLKIELEGFKPLEMSFTVGVEKKAIKIAPVIGTMTLYPKSGITSTRIEIKNAETLPWDQMAIKDISVRAKGNYEAKLLKEEKAVLLKGVNLNQTDSFRATIRLRSDEWTDFVNLTCNVKVNLKEAAIVLEKKTLQLNANDAYKGYDAVSTAVRWKNGGDIMQMQNVRVSVYCDPKDAKAKTLAADCGVIFSVGKENDCYQIKARLNNKTVAKGSYKFIVQAARDGKIWKTPLTLKVVNTAPDKAVKVTAKGSIDVLNREGSYMTLTPSLKAVNGTFEIPKDRSVKLTGRDAHLFGAVWNDNGKTIELRARENVTLVTNFQYTVTPKLTLLSVNGQTEEITTTPLKFKVKQGSVKMNVSPRSALLYSGSYNAIDLNMDAALRGADAPEIEKVTLAGNTDAFAYVYNKDGKGTLTMRDTGRAAKGKSYSLQFRVFFAERADNVKPVTVRYTVKVK